MTNKEAIKTLEANYPDACFEQLREAVEMAINALTKEAWKEEHPVSPLLQPSKQDADDLISRQAAIDAMEGVDWYHIDSDGQLTHGANSEEHEPLYKAKDVYKVLNDMPSAQPEKRTEERTETHGVCLDAIDRQATIDALEKVAELFPWRVPGNRDSYDHYNEGWNDAIGRAEIEIEKLPSAQPDLDEVYAHGETEAEARFHAQQRWIPCSERLPEKDGDYLTTLIDKDGNYVDVTEWQNIIGGRWVAPLDECDYCEIGNVVAWMPLPEVYRDGE